MPSRAAFEEVLLRDAEAHLRPDGTVVGGQLADDTVVERRVGHDVEDGRPGREHAVLDAQVRPVADDVVDRAVPPVDRAVVEAQLCQRGRLPCLELGHRVLVGHLGQQGGEVADVLLEQVEDRGDPPLAEEHPGPHALVLQLDAAGVRGLAEQLDAGLGVQPLAEEERRVGGERDLRGDEGLGGVPVRREVRGRDLEVQLHAGAGGLGRDRLAVGRHPLARRPLDVEVDVLAAGDEDRVVQGGVAVVGADPLALEVLGHDRREDADGDDVGPPAPCGVIGAGQRLPQVLLELEGGVARKRPRRHVELDVVARELGLVVGVGDLLEHLGVGEPGLEVLVDEVQLDLETRHGPVELEVALREHPLEDVQVLADLLPVALTLLARVALSADLFAHRTSLRVLALAC